MVDPASSRRLLCRALFVALAALILFLRVLPLGAEPTRWPGPDLLVALTLAIALRRPEYVPSWLVAAVFLVADLVLQQPPGLFAALMVLAVEVVRARLGLWRDQPPLAEWAVIAVLVGGLMLGNWLLLTLVRVAQAPVLLYLGQAAATVLAYPLVAFGVVVLLGVRRPAPGSVDALAGRR